MSPETCTRALRTARRSVAACKGDAGRGEARPILALAFALGIARHRPLPRARRAL